MTTLRHRIVVAAFLTLALGLLPVAAQAIDFGVRGGIYTDIEEAFVGVELLSRVQGSQWYLNPNLEWVFLENGDLIAASFDVHYDFPTSGQFNAWLGAGPTILFTEPDRGDSDTDAGLNLLAGLGFNPDGAVRPYLQGKIILADESEAVIAVGLRFF